ncbi:hypothetical protein DEU56DRAFT_984058 [Suillus clintonianus]|uniref:uncharacterized protein n=1 Tax=Suillus clintonianus TaxID=1904413 RepID=UPI001B871B17|nr:uncharacterized protein DEU56DRAFT_984058 [Suillus clintonianus]KAG2122482.1 hypothetical protein DEU56DRAFT_984058 [Suillus clintonianus]
MSGSAEIQSIRLEVIGGKNLKIPSWRMPAGIYVSINVDSRRRWKSAIRVLSSNESVVWGDTMTLSSHESPALSMEIRASYEVDRTLGNGEVIGKLQTSWDELLDHGDEPFEFTGSSRFSRPRRSKISVEAPGLQEVRTLMKAVDYKIAVLPIHPFFTQRIDDHLRAKIKRRSKANVEIVPVEPSDFDILAPANSITKLHRELVLEF